VYEVSGDRWTRIAPLPRPRGAAAAVILDGRIHLIGGASEPTMERASVGWHEIYDPQADRWLPAKPLPGARDHVGCVVHGGLIHVIGGRFNTFEYNTDLHHVYLPARDTWEVRQPLPTARSGHGLVVYRGRFFAMGGEAGRIEQGRPVQAKVFGQMESYDPASDSWQHHAPMTTPRHAVGATLIGDWIYVAGGGAVLGGGVQSAVHEAFTLS
jgi:N-acetylneuraminic acid mutarotase